MPRNLERKVGIYISRLGQLKYAEIGSLQAADILALRAGYQLCASVDNEKHVQSLFDSSLCQRRSNGLRFIRDVTYPTSVEVGSIGELIEKQYQRIKSESGEDA